MMQERLKTPSERYYTPMERELHMGMHVTMYVSPNLTSIYTCTHFVVELFDARMNESSKLVASAPHFQNH